MLKTVQFENNMREKLGVAYFIFADNLCVFTALDVASKGSSINYAEAIVHAICNEEQVDPLSMRFFDLQTRTSYTGGLTKPNPGDFEFDEVIIEPARESIKGIHAKSWLLTKCLDEVVTLFAAFIDGTPRQRVPRTFEAQFSMSLT